MCACCLSDRCFVKLLPIIVWVVFTSHRSEVFSSTHRLFASVTKRLQAGSGEEITSLVVFSHLVDISHASHAPDSRRSSLRWSPFQQCLGSDRKQVKMFLLGSILFFNKVKNLFTSFCYLSSGYGSHTSCMWKLISSKMKVEKLTEAFLYRLKMWNSKSEINMVTASLANPLLPKNWFLSKLTVLRLKRKLLWFTGIQTH